MKVYEVLSQQPQIIIESGIPVQGFVVRVRLSAYDELAEIHLTKLDPLALDSKVKTLLEARRRLAELGEE